MKQSILTGIIIIMTITGKLQAYSDPIDFSGKKLLFIF